jgi:hypothetical protein
LFDPGLENPSTAFSTCSTCSLECEASHAADEKPSLSDKRTARGQATGLFSAGEARICLFFWLTGGPSSERPG